MSQTGIDNSQASAEPSDTVSFVLVHCAFGGGWAWKYVAHQLRLAGNTVHTPSLTGLGERAHLGSPDVNLDTHIEDIVNLLIWEDLHDIIFVGWSYGGMVVTGVLDRIPERLAHVVYLDGEVPRDGDRSFDFWGEAHVAAMEQQAQETGDDWKAVAGDAADIEPHFRVWIPDGERRRG